MDANPNRSAAFDTFFATLRTVLEDGCAQLRRNRELILIIAKYPWNASPSTLLYRGPDGKIWQVASGGSFGYEEVARSAGSYEEYAPVVPRNFMAGPADPSWIKGTDAIAEQWPWVHYRPDSITRPMLEQIGEWIGSDEVGIEVFRDFLQKEEHVRSWFEANLPDTGSGEPNIFIHFFPYAERFFGVFMPGMHKRGNTIGMYGTIFQEFYQLYKELTKNPS